MISFTHPYPTMRFLSLLLLFALVAPFAHAQKDANKPTDDGIAGTWDYVVRPDDPVAQGTFELEWHDGELRGAIQTDAERKFDTVALEDDHLTVTFDQPGTGHITIRGTFSESTFDGEAEIEGQTTLPFVGTRQSSDDTPGDASEDSADMTSEESNADIAAINAVIGTWTYKVTPPDDDPVEGTFTIEQGPDGLMGTFQTNAARTMRFIEVEDNRLAFEFDQPGMGVVVIRGTVRGDNFEGEARPESAMGTAPMTATRLSAEDSTSN
jgi:hypothetical protein